MGAKAIPDSAAAQPNLTEIPILTEEEQTYDLRWIPHTQIFPGANYRRTFNQAKLEELSRTIKLRGVLQPITVRPVPNPFGDEERFEIVFGERRDRGSRMAGHLTIRAFVREMTDKEAAELRIIENCQREDVHPIEEAEGFEELHTKHGYSHEQIAAKINKSVRFVYQRMTLCKLTEKNKKFLIDEKVTPSVAGLVARVHHPKLQENAMRDVIGPEHGNPMSFAHALEHIQKHYMLVLVNARFDIGDVDLIPDAGACLTCPKKTGNQAQLFADVSSPDVCTDTACYGQKLDAWWKNTRRDAKINGTNVLSDADTKIVFIGSFAGVKNDAPYVSLDTPCPQDSKNRTYRKLFGKKKIPDVVIARDPHDGTIYDLIARASLKKALLEAGYDFTPASTGPAVAQDGEDDSDLDDDEQPTSKASSPTPSSSAGSSSSNSPPPASTGTTPPAGQSTTGGIRHMPPGSRGTSDADREKAREAAAVALETSKALLEQIGKVAHRREPNRALWFSILKTMLANEFGVDSGEDLIAAQYDFDDEDKKDFEKALVKLAENLTEAETRALVIELLVSNDLEYSVRSGDHSRIAHWLELFGVEPKKIEQEARVRVREAAKAAKTEKDTKATGQGGKAAGSASTTPSKKGKAAATPPKTAKKTATTKTKKKA